MTPPTAQKARSRVTHCSYVRHDPNLRRNIRYAMAEGAAFSLMVGMGETYLPAFVLFVGLGQVTSGLITTLPLVTGAVIQLISPLMIGRLGSYRRWVLCCATLQALSFVPLIFAALSGTLPTWLAYTIASVYWGAGMGAGPAWNAWIGTLVPPSLQTTFFTRRTRWTQVTALLGFAIGGVALYSLPNWFPKAQSFALLFGCAFVCRLFSLYFLHAQTEPIAPPSEAAVPVWPWQIYSRLRTHGMGRLLAYLLAVQMAAQVAAPYFTPYMLKQLQLSYTVFALLVSTSFLTKILTLPALGALARRHGSQVLLWIGGSGIVLLPCLWLVSESVWYLALLQVLSGLAWGAYDLAALLRILESLKPEQRSSVLTCYNVANALAVAAASLLGGLWLWKMDQSAEAYAVLFAFSTIARAMTLFLLVGLAPTARRIGIPIAFRTLTLRPSLGFMGVPLFRSKMSLRDWRKKLRVRK